MLVIFLILLGMLRFYGFLSSFGTFAYIVAQTRFVLHETGHTIVVGIYNCVEVIRIVNHSHIFNIT